MFKKPNFAELDRVVDEYERKHPLTISQKYGILDALYEEAKMFGHFQTVATLEGIEIDIQIARIVNTDVCRTS